MGIYSWKEQIRAWKRLPSNVLYDESGDFLQELYVTPILQTENAGNGEILTEYWEADDYGTRVNPVRTPLGKWVILALDSATRMHDVMLQRDGEMGIEKLDGVEQGRWWWSFRNEALGIQLAGSWGSLHQPNEFGDILMLETYRSVNGDVLYRALENGNRGNGVASVNPRIGPTGEVEVGDWLIFFRNSEKFDIRDRDGVIVLGSINEPLVIEKLGVEVFVTPGDRPFEFGDKFKFSTATVGVVSAEVSELTPFALMRNSDRKPPTLQLWPEDGSVIPPRPEISMVLEDANGVDMECFQFAISKNDGLFENIAEFSIARQGQVTAIPIVYKPTLFIGRYRLRISVRDLNGNLLNSDEGFSEFSFFVHEDPDLAPPEVEVRLNDERLTDGLILREQPKFEIQITDDHGIDPESVQVSFGVADEALIPLPSEQYELEFDEGQPTQAVLVFTPDLPNDVYQIQAFAADTSENLSEEQVLRFQLDEAATITELLNVPNPMRTNTFFTYTLAQVPDQVTVKIYTVAGRLIRTISDALARRGYNETYWDGRDENDIQVANGTYLYKVTIETESRKTERMGRLAILR